VSQYSGQDTHCPLAKTIPKSQLGKQLPFQVLYGSVHAAQKVALVQVVQFSLQSWQLLSEFTNVSGGHVLA